MPTGSAPRPGGQRPRTSYVTAQRARARRRRVYRRRRAAAGLLLLGLVALVTFALWPSSTPKGTAARATTKVSVPSIEAGVESWSLPSAISRESLVADGSRLTAIGGLDSAGGSLDTVDTVDPSTGSITTGPALNIAVHDASGATLPSGTLVFGGGSPTTIANVQLVGGHTPSGYSLPQPRSDSMAVVMSSSVTGRRAATAFVVGGYTGLRYLPEVLATRDGHHYTTVADLPIPVRYPAVTATGGLIYVFGGETSSSGNAVQLTDAIQVIDPATHRAEVIGHLPEALYGAAAFPIGPAVYVAGGEDSSGTTLTTIEAFRPANHKVLFAGLLPEAEAFGGYATVASGNAAVGYIVGGEVAKQSGPDQAGQGSGTLATVMSLRPSPYGGPAGSASAGSPFQGTLLIADRGNNRLIAINAERQVLWRYPGPSMPPPPGGFYFPDDAFFTRHGTAIISNQEGNDTIVEIGYPGGKVLWHYGHPGTPGTAPGYLNQPDDAYLLKSGVVTVADASNNRILFISRDGRILHQIGNGTDAHQPPTEIAYPNGDTPLANGDVLVSEINGSYVDEYTPAGKLVWSVRMASVNYPSDPQQIGSDLYLMTDYDPPAEGRVLEFDRAGTILWRYDAKSGEAALKMPSLAERLPNGLIMVNDDHNDRMVVIDPRTDSIVWQYGLTSVAGRADGMLSTPDGFDLLLSNGTTPTHPQTG